MKFKKFKKRFFLLCFFSVAASLIFCFYMYFSFHKNITDSIYSSGLNAVWARHLWVGKPHTNQEYQLFFENLKKNRISDVYFHVGPWLESDGGISFEKYQYADELVLNARKMYSELRLHAWIGQMTTKGGGPLDLENTDIRKNIVQSASIFLDIGFDGIHYDFEPVYSGDKYFIDLLKQTREITRSKERYLSIASGQVELIPHTNGIFERFAPKSSIWSRDYFTEIANNVDQVAVMLYDTGLPTDWLFCMYVKKETEILLSLMNDTTLFIGVPTYKENRPGHRPWAENIQTSMQGIKLGLTQTGEYDNNKFGIAIFAEWTTDEKEWEIFSKCWLGN